MFLQDGKSGKTCLYTALENKSYALAKFLIQHRAAVNISTFSGNSPLHVVSDQGNVEMVKMLLQKGASLYEKNIESESPKDVASTDEVFKLD